jgi:hypothetical protein
MITTLVLDASVAAGLPMYLHILVHKTEIDSIACSIRFATQCNRVLFIHAPLPLHLALDIFALDGLRLSYCRFP